MERKCNMSLVMCIMKYGILKHLQENMEASVLQTAVTPALVIILKHVITSFCLPVLSPPVYFLSPVGLHQIKQAVHQFCQVQNHKHHGSFAQSSSPFSLFAEYLKGALGFSHDHTMHLCLDNRAPLEIRNNHKMCCKCISHHYQLGTLMINYTVHTGIVITLVPTIKWILYRCDSIFMVNIKL